MKRIAAAALAVILSSCQLSPSVSTERSSFVPDRVTQRLLLPSLPASEKTVIFEDFASQRGLSGRTVAATYEAMDEICSLDTAGRLPPGTNIVDLTGSGHDLVALLQRDVQFPDSDEARRASSELLWAAAAIWCPRLISDASPKSANIALQEFQASMVPVFSDNTPWSDRHHLLAPQRSELPSLLSRLGLTNAQAQSISDIADLMCDMPAIEDQEEMAPKAAQWYSNAISTVMADEGARIFAQTLKDGPAALHASTDPSAVTLLPAVLRCPASDPVLWLYDASVKEPYRLMDRQQ